MTLIPFHYTLTDSLTAAERAEAATKFATSAGFPVDAQTLGIFLQSVNIECRLNTTTGQVDIIRITPQPEIQIHEPGMILGVDSVTQQVKIVGTTKKVLSYKQPVTASQAREAISAWFDEFANDGATHMMIVHDSYHAVKYPVGVSPDENALDVLKRHDARKSPHTPLVHGLMVQWIYDLHEDKNDQLRDSEIALQL